MKKIADVIVEVEREPETHAQVILIDEGVVVVPGMLYGRFFAFDPVNVRYFAYEEQPELRCLRVWSRDGFVWNMAQVNALVRQEV